MKTKSFIKISLKIDDDLITELNEYKTLKEKLRKTQEPDYESENPTDKWDIATDIDEKATMICDIIIQEIQQCPFESRLD